MLRPEYGFKSSENKDLLCKCGLREMADNRGVSLCVSSKCMRLFILTKQTILKMLLSIKPFAHIAFSGQNVNTRSLV